MATRCCQRSRKSDGAFEKTLWEGGDDLCYFQATVQIDQSWKKRGTLLVHKCSVMYINNINF